MTTTALLIAGEWRTAAGDATEPIVSPRDGSTLGQMACASPADIDAAVDGARTALDGGWGRTPGAGRRRLLLRLADEIRASASALSELAADDMGSPVAINGPAAEFCADYLEYFAGWADKVGGDLIPLSSPDTLDYTLRHPVGVVAAIVPWNQPLFLTIAKLAPALAAGCAVIVKPSELAPLVPLELGRCAERAGFPPGSVSVVTGRGDVGAALVEHPGVDMVSFTGGPGTGRLVGEAAARTHTRSVLELGGKSAQIVFADADLDAAAGGLVPGFVLNTGQQCIAGSRILVQRPVYDEVIERVVAGASMWSVGDPREPANLVGPLITEQHLDRVTGYVAEAGHAGRVVLGGERLGGDLAAGYYVSPTVVADADPTSRLCREEVFGPVAAIMPFDEPAEAVAMANDSEFGLAAGVWTSSVDTAHQAARRLRAGTVWVNTYLGVVPEAPFGGHKASGTGREGGWDAVGEFTETTNVMVQLRPW